MVRGTRWQSLQPLLGKVAAQLLPLPRRNATRELCSEDAERSAALSRKEEGEGEKGRRGGVVEIWKGRSTEERVRYVKTEGKCALGN